MDVYKAIISRRTIRKFKQLDIPIETLKKLVNAGRLAPSARNQQPLEYLIITDASIREEIFSTITWAIYLRPDYNPQEGEKPVAYIVVIVNDSMANRLYYKYDVGASVENIILSALEEGIGCCWIKSFKKHTLEKILKIHEGYFIDSVLALGYPLENPKYVDIEKGSSIKYWRDPSGRLIVPKRKLEDIVHINSLGQ